MKLFIVFLLLAALICIQGEKIIYKNMKNSYNNETNHNKTSQNIIRFVY